MRSTWRDRLEYLFTGANPNSTGERSSARIKRSSSRNDPLERGEDGGGIAPGEMKDHGATTTPVHRWKSDFPGDIASPSSSRHRMSTMEEGESCYAAAGTDVNVDISL